MTKKPAQKLLAKPRHDGPWWIVPSVGRPFFHFMVSVVVSLSLPISAHAGELRSSIVNCPIAGCLTQRHADIPARPRLTLVQAPRPAADTHIGPWHLVRTPAPENKETVSIMRTGELLKSDLDFAGLMIRCRGPAGLQIGFIVISPFPPKSQPQVTISTGQNKLHFKASVVPPGTIVNLPDEADILVQGPWQSARSLTVQIKGDGADIHGVVSLSQLSQAVALLQANCPAP